MNNGELEEGLLLLCEGAEDCRASSNEAAKSYYISLIARVNSMTGHLDEALPLLDEPAQIAEPTGSTSS